MNEIRFIDLFSGIGGFRLGLERANKVCKHSELWTRNKERQSPQYSKSRGISEGRSSIDFRCVWSCDWNKYANQVYIRHFGEENHCSSDIRRVNTKDIPDFNLLCAGFPCQSFSLAGKRKGFKDTRGTLFFEICRVAEAKRPDWLLLENVRGLLSNDEGLTFQIILESLEELGYWVEWQVFNSKYFGVPQNRERVFIIGHSRGTSFRPIFPITEGDRGDSKSIDKESQTDIAPTIDTKVGEQTHRSPYILQKIGNIAKSGHDSLWGRVYDPKGIAMNLNAEGGGLGAKTGLYMINATNPHKASEDRKYKISSESRAVKPPYGNQQPLVFHKYYSENTWVRTARKSGISPTLTSPDGGGQRNYIPHINQGMKIRRLTPLECERLQGFPDNWTEGLSDTQRYRVIGNAVTVNVIVFLGKHLMSEITNMGDKEQ